jgi:thermostable 8-oxoguanine DNA glycosylase
MAQTTNKHWDRCLELAKQVGELNGYGFDTEDVDEALVVAIERFVSSRADLPRLARPSLDEVHSMMKRVSHQESVRVHHQARVNVCASR